MNKALRSKFLPAICLSLCLAAVSEGSICVIEGESHIRWVEGRTEVALALHDESGIAESAHVDVEILDPDGRAVGADQRDVTLTTDVGRADLAITLSEEMTAAIQGQPESYRLRYRAVPEPADGALAEGVIAVSEIADGLFDLYVTCGDVCPPGSRHRLLVLTRDRKNKRPVGGVRLRASVDGGAEGLTDVSGETGPDGLSMLDLLMPAQAASRDDVPFVVIGHLGGVRAKVEGELRVDPRPALLLITDKKLYQPGQTMHMRLLALDSSRRALAGVAGRFQVTDPDGLTLFSAPFETSRWGVATADRLISETVRLGRYEVVATLGEERDDAAPMTVQTVQVSRYEMPAFSVTAKPDRGVYFRGEPAGVGIQASYIHGKPLRGAQLRVVRINEWMQATPEEQTVAEGLTDENGHAVATIDLSSDWPREPSTFRPYWRDVGFAAVVTDPASGRTERCRFDIRLSEQPIHLYLVGSPPASSPAVLRDFLVTAQYPDGEPALCNLTMQWLSSDGKPEGQALSGQTNRFGVARLTETQPHPEAKHIERFLLTARDRGGRVGLLKDSIYHGWDERPILVRCDRTVLRPREPVSASIQADRTISGLAVALMKGDQAVDLQIVTLVDGNGRVSFPYQSSFRGPFVVAAWPLDGRGSGEAGSQPVLYPHDSDLRLAVRADRSVYRPGDSATVDITARSAGGPPARAVMAVAAVDRALLERARSDSEFGGWWSSDSSVSEFAGWGEEDLGGVTLRDLMQLDVSRPIPHEYDLLTQVLLLDWPAYSCFETIHNAPSWVFGRQIDGQLAPAAALVQTHFPTERFPTSVESVQQEIAELDLGTLRDPWDVPYELELAPQGSWMELRFVSAGPDKRMASEDDFVARTLDWRYFEAPGRVLDYILLIHPDWAEWFVHDASALVNEMLRAGLDLSSLRDPWGGEYWLEIGVEYGSIVVRVRSAGPDGRRHTDADDWDDDITVWTSQADYFRETEQQMCRILDDHYCSAEHWPKNAGSAVAVLREGGLDFESLRDPWGCPYRIEATDSEPHFSDSVNIQVYGSHRESPERRTHVTPVTQRWGRVTVRSPGPDGEDGTYDDVVVADTARVLEESAASSPAPVAPAIAAAMEVERGGVGGLVRGVWDEYLAGVLITASGPVDRHATSRADGSYLLKDLPAGTYSVRFDRPGYSSIKIIDVPVAPGVVTLLDVVLPWRVLSQSIVVSGPQPILDTKKTGVGQNQATGFDGGPEKLRSTPRLRSYFPETLLWEPALETDASGRASLRFELADSITTWNFSVLASTVDGQIGQAQKEIRAFQPFFIELDPPAVLTQGDEIDLPVIIRNHLDRSLRAEVGIKPAPWFTLLSNPRCAARIAPNGFTREIFRMRAGTILPEGRLQASAAAGPIGDAVEKSVGVHPEGEEVVHTYSQVSGQAASLDIAIPPDAIPGSVGVELKSYPGLLSHVIESVEGIMERPYGCAEQTISSAYPGLLLLQYDLRHGGLADSVRKRAYSYLELARDRLMSNRDEAGGFSVWADGQPGVAITAYALRFLWQAAEFVPVDPQVLADATSWLRRRQLVSGGWGLEDVRGFGDSRDDQILTAHVARSLAAVGEPCVSRALQALAQRIGEIDEPYLIAAYGLAAQQSGDDDSARRAIERLTALAHSEADGTYWVLETNTPFRGWGTAGRIETTALAVQLLASAAPGSPIEDQDTLWRRGLVFLLRNKDRYGVWYSTQATVAVVEALIEAFARIEPVPPDATAVQAPGVVRVDGRMVATLPAAGADGLQEPLRVDLSSSLSKGTHRIEVSGQDGAFVQVVVRYYRPWRHESAQAPSPLRLDVRYDQTTIRRGETVTCRVVVERVGFRGYGMLLAEIGLPPGSEVDRESLQSSLNNGLYHYEILPDRVVAYLWPRAGGTTFTFTFRPRFGMRALTAPSSVYDYYNPEAEVVIPPVGFEVLDAGEEVE